MDNSNFFSPFCGAVSLTFDDGTQNQLQNAIPSLNDLDIKATFYITPNDRLMQNHFTSWQEVAKQGHEIGNHTLSHFCSNNFTAKRGGLEDRTLEDIEDDILAAQEIIKTIAPQQKTWTFAYPCYCLFVGIGENRQSFVPIIAKNFLVGRGEAEYGFGNHPEFIDMACVGGIRVERMSGFEMIGLVEELTWQGMWVILAFHDINGDRLSVQSEDYLMLLNYLKRKEKTIWTAPVREVAQKILNKRKAK